ncbi:MAG: YeeE/YedE family protein [Halobacteriovoraceae bacterium]|nr:YeeE/YedE family protein [Halobacteriovoraceae bacterium]|tara:strand:+ start:6619 stop:7041 length:423 start_codon:yes stop_codon:yes gene_type:complete
MNFLSSFFLGLLFSIGLSVSGMVNPNKVIGFLDLWGTWDPDLIFVMGGAAGLNFVTFRFVLKRKNPLLGENFHMPTANEIDLKLLVGSALFGIGWGLGGICPGPGIANLFSLKAEPIVFIIFMLLGMLSFKWFDKLSKKG